VAAGSTRDGTEPLRGLRAAQLRARARRGAIGQILLATIFLVGALSYARAPDHASDQSLLWMTGLLVLSMIDFGLGTRTLARVRRAPARAWVVATVLWGLLSTLVVGFLLRG
jgi:heme/copper-type cytochrome/quinol oxidase subunit 3